MKCIACTAFVYLGIWPSAPARAQAFQNPSITEDGAPLSTSSPIRAKGVPTQTFHSKIFRWDASSGIRVIAEVPGEGEPDCGRAGLF